MSHARRHLDELPATLSAKESVLESPDGRWIAVAVMSFVQIAVG